jgi:hypothetical protein
VADKKPISFFWSRAAVNAAGSEIGTLQTRLSAEVAEIVSRARRWFVHSIPPDGEDACYTCHGKELADKWEAFVRVGQFKPQTSPPNDRPSVRKGSALIRFPRADENPDNEVFGLYEDVEASLRQKGG